MSHANSHQHSCDVHQPSVRYLLSFSYMHCVIIWCHYTSKKLKGGYTDFTLSTNIHVTIDCSTVLPLCWELLPDRNRKSMGLWYRELVSRPDPVVLPVFTLHSLDWFWVSRRIFIYSHHNTFVFFSKMSVCLSVHLSVSPSVDRIVSALYLQQYSSDSFHICTSYLATLECVSHVTFVTLTLSSFDLGSNMTQ